MTQLLLHPPSCACCGGGNIEINSQYLDTFSAASFGESGVSQAAFLGGGPGVSIITESDIQARKAELGLTGSDWSYVSSLFFNDASFYNGVYFKWGDELGTAPTLTYSFVDAGTYSLDSNYINDLDTVGMGAQADSFVAFNNSDPSHYMIEFSSDEKNFIRQTLEDFAGASGIQFTEVDDNNSTSYGDLRFHLQDFSTWQQYSNDYTYGGFAYGPWGDLTR